ncbi:hypothetical protein OF83DRAFT_1176243 [Amylostereum chailletii]|nr:hypothetical protein OF83DRAFT_1176243 [Amylostereum chailletii]
MPPDPDPEPDSAVKRKPRPSIKRKQAEEEQAAKATKKLRGGTVATKQSVQRATDTTANAAKAATCKVVSLTSFFTCRSRRSPEPASLPPSSPGPSSRASSPAPGPSNVSVPSQRCRPVEIEEVEDEDSDFAHTGIQILGDDSSAILDDDTSPEPITKQSNSDDDELGLPPCSASIFCIADCALY